MGSEQTGPAESALMNPPARPSARPAIHPSVCHSYPTNTDGVRTLPAL